MVNGKIVLVPLLLAVLTSCDVERRANVEYTVTGQELGARGFREIDASDSKISFAGDDPVKRREAETLKDRYVERVTFKNNGMLRYEKLFTLGFTSRDTPTDMIESALDRTFYKDRGINFDGSKIRKTRQFTYLIQSSPTDNCFVAYAYFGEGSNARQNSPGNQNISASICYRSSSKSAAALEVEMVDILSRAHYDSGLGNPARGAASGPVPAGVPAPEINPPAPILNAPAKATEGNSDGGKDPSARLKQLDDAFRQNLMSPAEYQMKRKAIIDAM